MKETIIEKCPCCGDQLDADEQKNRICKSCLGRWDENGFMIEDYQYE